MALTLACGGVADEGLDRAHQPVIYGNDDRVDLLEIADASLVALAKRRVGALIPSRFVRPAGDSIYELAGPTLSEIGICEDEPHADEPALARCTALRVSSDRIVTAGHCVTAGWVSDAFFVTGYYLGSDLPMVSASGAHPVGEVLLHMDGDLHEDPSADFAVIALRDPVPDDGVVVEFVVQPPEVEESLIVAGHSEGLPLKIDAAAAVTRRLANGFELTTDLFAGGSGSTVFTSERKVAGIVVGGNVDYDFDYKHECWRARVVAGTPHAAEIAIDASVLQAAIHRAEPVGKPGCGTAFGWANCSGWSSGLFVLAALALAVSRRTRP